MSEYILQNAFILHISNWLETGNIKATYQLTPEDRTYLVMPLFHVHGLLAAFLAPLYAGGSVIVPQRFSASDFWSDFVTYKANWYSAVPTIHQILLKTPLPNPIPNIRFIRSCSSPLSPKTFQDLETTFNAPVLEAYAMTEAAHQMTSNPLPPAKRQPGSVGIGMGVDIRILDDAGKEVPTGTRAEICVRGENVTKGYLNNPSANESSFTKDGYFRTGDQGMKDPDGYVIITGRIKELINKGGEKISPIEVDNTLLSHPKVAEVVSSAIADEGHYGEDIGAAVVLKNEGGASENDLKAWVGDKLAKFKIPKQVYHSPHRQLVSPFPTLILTALDLDRGPNPQNGYWKDPATQGGRGHAHAKVEAVNNLIMIMIVHSSAIAHCIKMYIHTHISLSVACMYANQSITLQTNPHSRFKLSHNQLAIHNPPKASQNIEKKGRKEKNIPE